MNPWLGKLCGALLGWLLLRHPLGLLLGALVGHLLDMKLAARRAPPLPPSRDEDPYTVLGITREATDAEVIDSYRRLIAQYHPDKLGNAAKELRELAARRSAQINTAYDAIWQQRRFVR